MPNKKIIFLSAILATLSTSTSASWSQRYETIAYPSLWSYEAAVERIEWAYQCGYLDTLKGPFVQDPERDRITVSLRQKKHELLFDEKQQLKSHPSYPIFTRNGQDFFAPVNRNESCHIDDGVKLIGYKQLAFKAQACSQQRYLAFYEHGITEGEYTEARDLEKAPRSVNNHATQVCTSLYKYEASFYNDENDKKTFSQIQSLAQQGIAMAQYQLGWFYFHGQYIEQNYAQAAKWYEKAAKQDHQDAQMNLAVMYEMGRGISLDLNKAFYWFKQAATLNHPLAQYHVGRFYENGFSIEKNLSFAIDWYKKAMLTRSILAYKALDRIYDGDIIRPVTALNRSTLTCPQGFIEHPDRKQCVNSFKAHINNDGVIFSCDTLDKNLIFDPKTNTCFKEVDTPPRDQQCREGFVFNHSTQHCEEQDTYEMSCPSGYTHIGYGKCSPEWEYRAYSSESHWLDESYEGENAIYRGALPMWDGTLVTGEPKALYYCSNHQKCEYFSDLNVEGYIYARGSSQSSHTNRSISAWHRNIWFGEKHIDQYKVQTYYSIKRRKNDVQYKRCSDGYIQQGLTCIQKKQNYVPSKICEKGRFSLDESSCHYEHREKTVAYSFHG